MGIRSRATKIVSLVAISAILMALLACASDEPAAPAGPSAEEIAKLVSDSVNASVSQAVADAVPEGTSAMEIQKMVEAAIQASAQPGVTRADVEAAVQSATAGQLTGAEVQRIVDASVRALPAPQMPEIDVSAIRGLVQQAVSDSVPEGVSAAEIAKLVEAAIGASTAGVPTRDELTKSIEGAVMDAASAQLTAAEVQKIVDASMMATEAAAMQAQKAAEEAAKAASGAAMAADDAAKAAGGAATAAEGAAMAVKEAADAAMMGAMESMERMIDLPPVMSGYTRTVVSPFSFEEDVKSPRPLRPGMTLAQDQSVTVPWAGTIRHIIPGRMGSGYGRSWNQWAFMSPFITGHDLQPQAALAVAYDKNADATSYILHFDPDAVFHDGTPVTTADVKASWEFSASPEEQAPWGGIITYMKDIVGGAAVVSGDATTAEGLVPIDDHTLRVDLVRSNQLWPLEMSTSWLGVHKGHIQSQTDENWAEHPIGVGPYQVNYDPETRDVDVTPAPNWWKTDPPMPTVSYHIRHVPDRQVQEIQFRNSEVDAAFPFGDIAEILLPTHDLNRDMLFRKGASAGMWFFAFDQGKPPFDDINVRKAFLHGADHKTITEALWPASFVATEIMHDGFPCGYKHEGWAYDPELAREALAASSYGSADALPPMTVSVFRPVIVSSAEAIQEQLKENLGITLNIEVRESGQAEGEEVGIYRRSAGAVIADPDTALAFLTHPDAPLQTGVMHGSNADKLRELWATARSMSLGEPGRCDAYQAIENEWLSSYPVMPIAGEGRLGANIGIMVQPWLRNWDHLGQNGTFFIGMPYWQIVTRDRTNAEYYR